MFWMPVHQLNYDNCLWPTKQHAFCYEMIQQCRGLQKKDVQLEIMLQGNDPYAVSAYAYETVSLNAGTWHDNCCKTVQDILISSALQHSHFLQPVMD